MTWHYAETDPPKHTNDVIVSDGGSGYAIMMHNEVEAHKNNNLVQKYNKDAGYDIKSGEDVLILPGRGVVIETGLHVYIPSYLFGVVQGRSGLSINHNIETGNAGIIDPGFTGPIKVKLYNRDLNEPFRIRIGDRIAQLVFHIRPAGFMGLKFSIIEKDIADWPETDRGNNGIGSTGRK